MRVTPENIQELKFNEIFVFGSNGEGLHYGGAAHIAHKKFGAVIGQSRGPQGESFAINTMDGIETIKIEIRQFLIYTMSHPENTFFVTEIGCGIAGYSPEQIAPLFQTATTLKNVYLPKRFWDVLNNNKSK